MIFGFSAAYTQTPIVVARRSAAVSSERIVEPDLLEGRIHRSLLDVGEGLAKGQSCSSSEHDAQSKDKDQYENGEASQPENAQVTARRRSLRHGISALTGAFQSIG